MDALHELSFGPFCLNMQSRTLVGQAGSIPLPGRAFDLLVTLIEGRAAPMPKDELLRRVWQNVVVEENNLHVQIATIRRALGRHHRYIVTIPGRGYRFVGDAVELHPVASPTPAEAASFSTKRAAPEPPPNNLPAELTNLIGRDREFVEVATLLKRARLVSIVGPGGVGKTKLALAIARQILPHMASGVWLVELKEVSDPTFLASAIAAELRIEELPGRTPIDSLLTTLRSRQILLLLDGCEHMVRSIADFVHLLLQRCPIINILCASQEPLGVAGEHVLRLDPFDVTSNYSSLTVEAALGHPAIQLFVERASAADPRFTLTSGITTSVADICRHLDGIPLAIELAAARVPLLGLEPLRMRIVNRLALLGDEASAERGTLRAMIEWSYGLSSPVERQVLRRLSVFAGGFTLHAAEHVAAGTDVAESQVTHSVGRLVYRSLVTTGPDLIRPRHRILETTREFAMNELMGVGEYLTIARRHAMYCCSLMESAEAEWEHAARAEWIAPLIPELDNVRAALRWCFGADGDTVLGARLAAAATRFWFEGGSFTEGRRWVAAALEHPALDFDPLTVLRLYRGLASLTLEAAPSVTAARQAARMAANHGDQALEASCRRTLTVALTRQGEYMEAETEARKALALTNDVTHPRTLAQLLGDMAILRGFAKDYAAARRYTSEAQVRLTALGDDRSVAICLQHAAEFEFAAGEVAAALALAEEAVTIFRVLNSRYWLGIGLSNLAAYRLAQEDAEGGGRAAQEALTVALEIEDQPGVAIAVEHLAMVAALSGSIETAARLHGCSEQTYKSLGIERQGTEEYGHIRLAERLSRDLSPERIATLEAEGRLLGPMRLLAQHA